MRAKLVVAIALLAETAHASKDFPDRIELKTGADLPDPPLSCRFCHNNDEGGDNTATTLFAQTMIGFGLQSGSRLSVDDALARLADEKPDTDGDGLDDFAELLAGRNPTVPEIETEDGGVVASGEAPPNAVEPFQTGCGVLHGGKGSGRTALLALLAGLLLRRRAR